MEQGTMAMVASIILYVLLILHTPDGAIVEINPDQVTSMRGPRGDVKHQHERIFSEHAHCLINLTDGKFVTVSEDCSTVRRMMKGQPSVDQKEPEK